MQQNETLLLSTEEALETSSYLRDLSRAHPAISTAVPSLFARCCLAVNFDLPLDELRVDISDLANRILTHPEADRLDLDPLLVVELHRVLKRAEAAVPALDTLLGRIAFSLTGQPAETLEVGRVRYIATRLADLGFPIRPARASRQTAALMDSPDRWFGFSVPELAELAHHFMADRKALDEFSIRILSILALAELRNYRVDLGCTLLRAVFELGKPVLEANEALNFIALQRRRDGRYGFPNQFVEGSAADSDPHLAIFLPLTVHAVWLFDSAAQGRRQLQAVAMA